MFAGVVKCFLHNPVNCHLDNVRQHQFIDADFAVDAEPGNFCSKLIAEHVYRRADAEFVEHRRRQVPRDFAQVIDGFPDPLDDAVKVCHVYFRIVLLQLCNTSLDAVLDDAERLRDTVVQVGRDALAFMLLRSNDPATQLAQQAGISGQVAGCVRLIRRGVIVVLRDFTLQVTYPMQQFPVIGQYQVIFTTDFRDIGYRQQCISTPAVNLDVFGRWRSRQIQPQSAHQNRVVDFPLNAELLCLHAGPGFLEQRVKTTLAVATGMN